MPCEKCSDKGFVPLGDPDKATGFAIYDPCDCLRTESVMKIILDVWGGEGSQDHVARFIRTVDDALEMTRTELARGFLVNLRAEAGWASYEDFDARSEARTN